jgi:hypothetical protein
MLGKNSETPKETGDHLNGNGSKNWRSALKNLPQLAAMEQTN